MSYPKYDTLPQIFSSRGEPDLSPKQPLYKTRGDTLPLATASMPSFNNALVPLASSGKFGNYGNENSWARDMQARLALTEQSNRALLEEVVRLQNEMRGRVSRVEDEIRREISERESIEQSLRPSKQIVMELGSRLQLVEQNLETGQSSVRGLSNQVKKIEQNVLASQKDVLQRNDNYFSRLNSVAESIQEWSNERGKVNGALSLFANELKSLKHGLEIRTLEYQSLQQEFQKRNSQIENESHTMVDYFRKTQDYQSDSEYQQQQLRSNVESRLLEIRDSLIDLRNKSAKNEAERRSVEQGLNKRMSEHQAQVSEQARMIEDLRHEQAKLTSSTNQAFERERIENNERLLRSEDTMKRHIHGVELNLKNELLKRIADFEKLYQVEKEQRHLAEKNLRDETQSSLDEMQKKWETELLELKKKIKEDRAKFNNIYVQLNKSVDLIDRTHGETFEKISRALKAEIASRESQDKALSSKTDELNHKLGIAIKTIQTSLSALESKYKDLRADYRKEVEDLKSELHLSSTRAVADLDARLEIVSTKLKDHSLSCDMKLQESENLLLDRSAKQTQQLSIWHEQTAQRVSELQEVFNQLRPTVTELQAQLGNHRLETNSRHDKEQETRINEIETLRNDVNEKMKNMASRFVVDQLEESLNHQRDDLDLALAECKRIGDTFTELERSCDTRLTDETKTRTEQLIDLREQLSRLKRLVDSYHRPNQAPTPGPDVESPSSPQPPASGDRPKIKTPTPPPEGETSTNT